MSQLDLPVPMRTGVLGSLRDAFGIYLELGKSRLSLLVVMTTLVGFVLGSAGLPLDLARLGWTLLGTLLTALGANALNQWMERELDARMVRTRRRPLPSARISPGSALLVASLSVFWGLLLLLVFVNPLTAALALGVELLYLLVYTPMKQRTPLCTLVGAVCGAIPPMMGWTAASGSIGIGAWVLALLLFLWQIPHFLALAWLYREDYARGGFRMLPLVDRAGSATSLMTVLYSLALLPLGFVAALAGLSGWMTAVLGSVLGLGLLLLSVRLFRVRSEDNARRVFRASLAYLPLFLIVLLLDRGTGNGPLLPMPLDPGVATATAAIASDPVAPDPERPDPAEAEAPR